MKLSDNYRELFLQSKQEGKIQSFRLFHGKKVYETACSECLERKGILNKYRMNFMMNEENVCKFILVLGLSKSLILAEFYEFLSFAYDIKEIGETEKNLEIIIKFFSQGYDNLVLQKQNNINITQLQEKDELKIISLLAKCNDEPNPIGKMQELITHNLKLNIIEGFYDNETLNLSFLGIFQLSPIASKSITLKQKRKTKLYSLCMPFLLFFIEEQRIFNIDRTYLPFQQYWKNFSPNKEQTGLEDVLSIEEDIKNKKILQNIGKSPLFFELIAVSNERSFHKPSVKPKNKDFAEKSENTVICGNSGKAPAFISCLKKDQDLRAPSLGAGVLPVKERKNNELRIVETLVFTKDQEVKALENDLINNILSQEYDSFEDNKYIKQENPKGDLLEIAMQQFKTTQCLQFRIFQIQPREFECILSFSKDPNLITRGRGTSKKICEKVSAGKMIPLIQEFIAMKEQQFKNKHKNIVLFSTNKEQFIKQTDKVSHQFKTNQLEIQKSLESNLYLSNKLVTGYDPQKEIKKKKLKLKQNIYPMSFEQGNY